MHFAYRARGESLPHVYDAFRSLNEVFKAARNEMVWERFQAAPGAFTLFRATINPQHLLAC